MEHHYEKVEDILVHEGDDYAKFMGSVAPPIYQSSLFVRPTTANGIPEHPYAYTRASNPTVEAVEKKIAALEGAGMKFRSDFTLDVAPCETNLQSVIF